MASSILASGPSSHHAAVFLSPNSCDPLASSMNMTQSLSSEGEPALLSMAEGTTSDTQTENETPPESPDDQIGVLPLVLGGRSLPEGLVRPSFPHMSSHRSVLSTVASDEEGYEAEAEYDRKLRGEIAFVKQDIVSRPVGLKRPVSLSRLRSASLITGDGINRRPSLNHSQNGTKRRRYSFAHPKESNSMADIDTIVPMITVEHPSSIIPQEKSSSLAMLQPSEVAPGILTDDSCTILDQLTCSSSEVSLLQAPLIPVPAVPSSSNPSNLPRLSSSLGLTELPSQPTLVEPENCVATPAPMFLSPTSYDYPPSPLDLSEEPTYNMDISTPLTAQSDTRQVQMSGPVSISDLLFKFPAPPYVEGAMTFSYCNPSQEEQPYDSSLDSFISLHDALNGVANEGSSTGENVDF